MTTELNELEKDLLGDDVVPTEQFGSPEGEEPKHEEQAPAPEPAFKGYLEKLGYQIPEGIDLTNEDEAIQKIKEFNKPQDDEDDFIKEYKSKKLNPEDFIKEKMERISIKTLPVDEGIKKYFSQIKDEQGNQQYTEDDIEEFLTSKSKIEKTQMWNQIKSQIEEKEPVQQEQENNFDINKFSQEYNTKSVPVLIQNATSELIDADNIYGIPYGKADRDEFNKKFSELMSIDAKGELMQVYPKPVMKIINNPSELYKLLYIYDKLKTGSFDVALKKNEIAEEALSKMGVSRKQTAGEYRATAPPPVSDDFV